MKATVFSFLFSALCLSSFAGNLVEPELEYIENQGQWEENILFKADLSGGYVFMESQNLTYLFFEQDAFNHGKGNEPKYIEVNGERQLNPRYTASEHKEKIQGHAYKVHFLGAHPEVYSQGEQPYSHYYNYFKGNDTKKWKSNVPVYKHVIYKNLYKSIDLNIYSQENFMKSDYVIHPGGDVRNIQLLYEGVDDMEINDEGQLLIKTSVNFLHEFKPYAYQIIQGEKIAVECSFKLSGHMVSFELGDYNKAVELIIDPTLVFSTYSGSTADNWGSSATYDADGNMFLGGITLEPGYPTTVGAFQTDFGGGEGFEPTDIVITKFTANGTSRLYSTHLGGSANELLSSLLCTPQNELIVLATTGSADYPVSFNAFDNSFNGGSSATALGGGIDFFSGTDIAIIKFNTAGSDIVGATFFGGSGNDGLNDGSSLNFNYGDDSRGDLQIDQAGNIYVVTNTRSTNIPGTTGAAQPSSGGSYDAVVAKLNSNLSALSWATYYGGSGQDAGFSIQIDKQNNIFITGGTNSTNLPAVANGLNPTYLGGRTDGFIAKLNSAGTSFTAATYLGTSSYDQSFLMDLDKSDNVYVFGQTLGAYPVSSGVYSNTGSKQFIHKLNNNLNTTGFSTVFGRQNYANVNISPTAFLVDICENIYAVGWGGAVNNSGFTSNMTVTSDAFQSTTDGSDFYLINLSRDAASLIYATYFGENGGVGDHVDGGTSRFDKNGFVYQAVCASCGGTNNFPTTNGAYSNDNLSSNCNMAGVKFQFDLGGMQLINILANPSSGCAPLNAAFSYTSTRPATTWAWDFGDGTTSTAQSPSHTYANPGIYLVKLTIGNPSDCNPLDSGAITVVVFSAATNNITRTICEGDTTFINGTPFMQGGNYVINIPRPGSCDSIVNLTLIVNSVKRTSIDTTICEGERVIIGNESFDKTGVYQVILNSSVSCDSIITLTLTVNPTPNSQLSASICEGEYYYLGSDSFNIAGTYPVFFTASTGCDSIVTLQLTVDPTAETTLDKSICIGESVSVGGQVFTQSGTYTISLKTSLGCDSVVTLQLNVTDSIIVQESRQLCTGQTLQIGDSVLTSSGTYVFYYTAAGGCDSTWVLDLAIVDTIKTFVSASICQGDTYSFSGQNYGTSGTYTATLPASGGCDSLVTLQLAVNDTFRVIRNETICQGESVQVGSLSFDKAGTYEVNLSAATGCDSVVVLNLSVEDFPVINAVVDSSLVYVGSSVQLNVLPALSTNTYSWEPSNGVSNPNIANPTATVTEDTWFVVTVSTRNGCSVVDSVLVEVQEFPDIVCGEENIFLPNAFTPNGDQENDVYFVKTKQPLESMHLMIYNRWGEKVFETTDQTIGWDGTFKGKQVPVESYAYYFEGVCGEVHIVRKGNISVIR